MTINLHKYVDKIHRAVKVGATLELPSLVQKCGLCKGLGEYKQTWTIGCGMGSYRSTGPCDYCKHEKLFMRGSGFKYKNTNDPIPESVLIQIYEMNKPTIEAILQLEN